MLTHKEQKKRFKNLLKRYNLWSATRRYGRSHGEQKERFKDTPESCVLLCVELQGIGAHMRGKSYKV